MSPSSLYILSVLCGGVAGMVCFALAMDRHHERVYGEAPPDTAARGLRLAAWACLAVLAVPCVQGWGLSIGAIVWVGSVSVGALAATALMTWCPRLVPLSGAVAAALSCGGWLFAA
ncbi:DUF3325 domain-containing protein [Cupriavidus agavae]|uniref:Uncharacterized protein DUF3325 n=1 Tax=Cupriavidus agavae TaxID=1001822 RepID=A0A4Q7RZM1_9BURK|nr:DUF3325 domain-containing protein [Cupriavidus agavae]RZT39346.1 uncharacterized protein DUF3325 [Cupriavidus agavae]